MNGVMCSTSAARCKDNQFEQSTVYRETAGPQTFMRGLGSRQITLSYLVCIPVVCNTYYIRLRYEFISVLKSRLPLVPLRNLMTDAVFSIPADPAAILTLPNRQGSRRPVVVVGI